MFFKCDGWKTLFQHFLEFYYKNIKKLIHSFLSRFISTEQIFYFISRNKPSFFHFQWNLIQSFSWKNLRKLKGSWQNFVLMSHHSEILMCKFITFVTEYTLCLVMCIIFFNIFRPTISTNFIHIGLLCLKNFEEIKTIRREKKKIQLNIVFW